MYLALYGPQGLVIFDHPADYERFRNWTAARVVGAAQPPMGRNASRVGGGGSGWGRSPRHAPDLGGRGSLAGVIPIGPGANSARPARACW